jgi:hypothetical protein
MIAPRRAAGQGRRGLISNSHYGMGADRGREGSRLPSLRTVQAVFPHTALQSAVSSSGVSHGKPGRVKREQPGPREEGIVPSFVVFKAAAHAGPLFPFP